MQNCTKQQTADAPCSGQNPKPDRHQRQPLRQVVPANISRIDMPEDVERNDVG